MQILKSKAMFFDSMTLRCRASKIQISKIVSSRTSKHFFMLCFQKLIFVKQNHFLIKFDLRILHSIFHLYFFCFISRIFFLKTTQVFLAITKKNSTEKYWNLICSTSEETILRIPNRAVFYQKENFPHFHNVPHTLIIRKINTNRFLRKVSRKYKHTLILFHTFLVFRLYSFLFLLFGLLIQHLFLNNFVM